MYHFFRQLWLALGVKLMEINSNLFSRWLVFKSPKDRDLGTPLLTTYDDHGY